MFKLICRLIPIAIGLMLLINMANYLEKDHNSKSWTWTFGTEQVDMIKISLDVSDGYDLTDEYEAPKRKQNQFKRGETTEYEPEGILGIMKDGEFVGEVCWMPLDNFDKEKMIKTGSEIESGKHGFNEYVFWSNDGKEYSHATRPFRANVMIVVRNSISEESARECFERLTIQKIR